MCAVYRKIFLEFLFFFIIIREFDVFGKVLEMLRDVHNLRYKNEFGIHHSNIFRN